MSTAASSSPANLLRGALRARVSTAARDADWPAPEWSGVRRSFAKLSIALRMATVAVDGIGAAGALVFVGAVEGASLLVPLLVGAWLLLLRACGAYGSPLAPVSVVATKAIVAAGLIGALTLVALGPSIGLRPERATPAAILVPVAFLLLGRLVVGALTSLLRRSGALCEPVLLVGAGPDAREVLENLQAWPRLHAQVIGICADTDEDSILGIPVLGPARACGLLARDVGLKTVIVAPSGLREHDRGKIETELSRAGLQIMLAPSTLGVDASRLSPQQLGGLPVLRVARCKEVREAGKRVFDLVLASVLLLALVPVLALIAVLVRLDSPGPAFFRQRRIGRNGRPFELWKFRTMREDAEALLGDVHPTEGGNGLFKLRNDPRVTRLGRWLRRTSLDELPQLWNVVTGEMSLVGPRPALPREVAEFDDFTLRRLRAKPGITGLWQVSGRSDASFATYSRMDAFYADNWTLLGDLKILLQTIPAVLGARGAY